MYFLKVCVVNLNSKIFLFNKIEEERGLSINEKLSKLYTVAQ